MGIKSFRYNPAITLSLRQIAVVTATFGFSLSFVHQAFWISVFVGAFLLTLDFVLGLTKAYAHVNRKSLALIVALIFLLILSLCWGALNQLYNYRGLVMVGLAVVVGYYASRVKVNAWLGWTPFAVFGGYFFFCSLLNIDPSEILPRNSENYISIILLGLFATSVLVTKPVRPTSMMYAASVAILLLSIWAEGRSGIVSAFLLLLLIVGASVLNLRISFSKQLLVLVVLVFLIVFLLLYQVGAFERLSQRGFSDYSRGRIISEYFSGLSTFELLMGKNYFSIEGLGRYGYNLHNSFLSVWANGSILYLGFILWVVAVASLKYISMPFLAIATLPLSVRAITDTQIFFGKYDYIIFAGAFIILNSELQRLYVLRRRKKSRF